MGFINIVIKVSQIKNVKLSISSEKKDKNKLLLPVNQLLK